jgi:hypothetical protein
MIDFLKNSLPQGQWTCNKAEGSVFRSGTRNEGRPSKMKGTARVLFCHIVGYLPCRYRNIDVIIAVTFGIVFLVYKLFGCYFARLQLKAAGMSAS